MQGFGHADVLVVLQVPRNAADAVPCERLQKIPAPNAELRNRDMIVSFIWIWISLCRLLGRFFHFTPVPLVADQTALQAAGGFIFGGVF